MASPQSNENKLIVPAQISNVLQRQPDQINPLQPTQFRLILWRTNEVVYFCQSVNLPGLSLGATQVETPLGVSLPQPGTRFEFDEFEVNFLVNEDMSNWKEISTWMRGLAPMEEQSFDENTRLVRSEKVPLLADSERFCDASLVITTSANTPSLIVDFFRVFPTRITSIQFDSTLSDPESVTASATFNYSHYNIRDYT